MLLLLKVVLHIAESWGETKIAVKTFLFIQLFVKYDLHSVFSHWHRFSLEQ